MMVSTPVAASTHRALMDSIYRRQRHIYDLTRKYYLFGRDTLIDGMDCRPGMAVLEVGCGTGRNLARIARRWPGVQLHGFDISPEMLATARVKLGTEAALALGDAVDFDPAALFGLPAMDRVMISFALSMIPDWRGAIAEAARALGPSGALHIVDFGDFAGLPAPFRAMLHAWLAKFHVTPRRDLRESAAAIARSLGLEMESRRGPLGYYEIVILRRPAA